MEKNITENLHPNAADKTRGQRNSGDTEHPENRRRGGRAQSSRIGHHPKCTRMASPTQRHGRVLNGSGTSTQPSAAARRRASAPKANEGSRRGWTATLQAKAAQRTAALTPDATANEKQTFYNPKRRHRERRLLAHTRRRSSKHIESHR